MRSQPRGFRAFARRYGWRAYALPILAVVTLTAIIEPNTGATTPSSSATFEHHVHRGQQHPQAGSPHTLPSRGPVQQLHLTSDSTPCTSNSQPKWVVVSIEAQRVWMCQVETQVYSTLVTTGAVNVGNGTPLGTWQIQSRETDRYLVGPGYRDFVKYWMPFNGDFGFHDASWQTMAYGAPGYRDNGSHGCVHLPLSAMRWLYDWAPVGTSVTITD
jgi:lipoprotein-anchoring transpeptidase ErfK/SrfK